MSMQSDYVIIADSTCDMPINYYKENGVDLLSIDFTYDGVNYLKTDENNDYKDFYSRLRNGGTSKTTQVGAEDARAMFEKYLSQGIDVLSISLSSGISGTAGTMKMVAEELAEKYPDRKVAALDSLCASMGEGLLLYKAVEQKKKGVGFDEMVKWLEEFRYKVIHYFTVDDLNFLHRGGRVSKANAVVGSMLGIKPVLNVNNTGHLIPVAKIRGRKQSLNKLVDLMHEKSSSLDHEVVLISHGDCLEDAEYVASLVRSKFTVGNLMINMLGPTIGTHTGPNLIALFFIGTAR